MLEFQHASVVFPPDSAVVRPAVNNICDMGDSGHPAWDACCTGRAFDTHGHVGCFDGNIYMARLCLLGRPGMESMMQRNEEYVDIRGWSHGHTVIWDPGVAESRPLAVCYDWDEVFGWIGHDEGNDYSPGGALGYLPRCLNSRYGYDDALSDRDQSAGLEPCAAGDNVHRRGPFPREEFRSL